MKARLHDMTFTRSGSTLLTLEVWEDIRSLWDELQEKFVEFTLKKFREKRSLDANAYAWVLIHKLSQAVKRPVKDVYLDAVMNVGGNAEIICVRDKAVDKLCEFWSKNGIGWQAETMPSKLDGCTNVILYYGSSTFNVEQMSRMIDNLVEDCRSVGIETMPPDKLESLLEGWK